MSTKPRTTVKNELAEALHAIAPAYGNASHRVVAGQIDAARVELPRPDYSGMQAWFKNALGPVVDPTHPKREGGAA